nr:hypothetical protein GCM10023233_30890 [Brevibacterium otitidis]
MSPTTKTEKRTSPRESWGSLRRLPSGRWQARYPGADGEIHTARTDDDRALTFETKTDARTWLSGVHRKIALGTWESPQAMAARLRAEAEAEAARTIGFTEYAERWVEMIRTQPSRSGKMRSAGTIRSYKGKVHGYLIPEFGDTPVRAIDKNRIREMTDKLDKIPSPLNPKSKFNGVTRPVQTVLMMILRQAARDGYIVKEQPSGSCAGERRTVSRATPWQPQRRHHPSGVTTLQASTARSGFNRCPIASSPSSSKPVKAVKSGQEKVALATSRSFEWDGVGTSILGRPRPYPRTDSPTLPTPSTAKSR